MNITTYSFEEMKHEAQSLAAKTIKEAVDWEVSANNIKPKTTEWYLLEHLKQRVIEQAHLGILK